MSERTIRHEMLAAKIANIRRPFRGCYGVRRVHTESVKGSRYSRGSLPGYPGNDTDRVAGYFRDPQAMR